MLAARQTHDDVGSHAAFGVGRCDGRLLLEIAVLEHPGQLDDAFQLQLAPAAAHAGPLERVHQPAGLAPQFLAGRIERGDPLDERRARLRAAALRFPNLAIHLLERFRDRREQLLDRLLARVEIGRGFRARLAQPRFGQIEKRPVVGFQRFGGERLERLAQLRVGLFVELGTLGADGALAFELVAKTRQALGGRQAIPPMRRWRDQS